MRLACGHFFCRSCIENAKDCLLCGADARGLQPEVRLQGKQAMPAVPYWVLPLRAPRGDSHDASSAIAGLLIIL